MNGLAFAARCIVLLGALSAAVSGQSLTTVSAANGNGGNGATTSRAAFLVFEAHSNSRYTQLDVVNEIGAIIAKPRAGFGAAERSDMYDALSAVALSGTGIPALSGSSTINDFPLLRMEACHELGVLGGARAEKTLLRVLQIDDSPLVLSETVYDLGKLRQDPQNRVSNAIVAALGRATPKRGDGIFAYQALIALAELAKAGHGAPDPAVYAAIAEIGKMGYGVRVDREAAAALRSVMNYG